MKAVAEPGSGLRNAPFADTSVEELDPEVRDAPRPVSPAHARRTLAGRVTTAALGCNLICPRGGFLTSGILPEKRLGLVCWFFPSAAPSRDSSRPRDETASFFALTPVSFKPSLP